MPVTASVSWSLIVTSTSPCFHSFTSRNVAWALKLHKCDTNADEFNYFHGSFLIYCTEHHFWEYKKTLNRVDSRPMLSILNIGRFRNFRTTKQNRKQNIRAGVILELQIPTKWESRFYLISLKNWWSKQIVEYSSSLAQAIKKVILFGYITDMRENICSGNHITRTCHNSKTCGPLDLNWKINSIIIIHD